MTSRTEATAARKEQIVRAAIAVLADRGYRATTFDAICQTAGLSSKRLITYHFSGKEDLFAAVADHVVAAAEHEMRPAWDAATDPCALLAAVIRASVAFTARHLAEGRALQEIIRKRRGRLGEASRAIRPAAHSSLRRRSERGSLPRLRSANHGNGGSAPRSTACTSQSPPALTP
jgi:AcrR family transcriptional regulator